MLKAWKKIVPSSIADKTNWAISRRLKIERGVNKQGVNLLKKVMTQLTATLTGVRTIQMFVVVPRWRAAIKAPKAYIEKNYTVNGGNYFRKNADGSVGDDVSAVHVVVVIEQF